MVMVRRVKGCQTPFSGGCKTVWSAMTTGIMRKTVTVFPSVMTIEAFNSQEQRIKACPMTDKILILAGRELNEVPDLKGNADNATVVDLRYRLITSQRLSYFPKKRTSVTKWFLHSFIKLNGKL